MIDPRVAPVQAAKIAVAVTFATNGIAFAGWLARAPAVRNDLGLSPAGLGLLLLCLSGAAVLAIPLAGPLVQRFGAARAVLTGSMSVVLGLIVLGTGTALGSVPIAGAGLVLLGAGNSLWDVAMNVEGATVERRVARTLMPRFHAAFSLGTVGGAGLSALAAYLEVSVTIQVCATALLAAAIMLFTVRRFLPAETIPAGSHPGGRVRDAWREPRTLLIGVIMLGFGFTEGAANDWLAISLVDGYHATETVGAIGFGFFVTAMTVGRLFGGSAIERWGRVAALRVTAISALFGLLLVVSGLGIPVVLIGALLWGAGASLGFPVGMSAAADDPLRAAIRVSVAGSIGYGAFLAGPPLIGLLAEHFGILRALFLVVVAIGLGLIGSGAARPLQAATNGIAPTGPPSDSDGSDKA
ncbi:MFS transporter [Winogradskya consettensis]|uniref:MFS transporter n=1 Tax=Winogradskya consettensis TaxID=113560 RepID=A0A919T1G2_9ACTN|nr:MFS transporter [Actinoplanes consettensis]GIM81472.1 MFS transporter [Actinoplanes consettensis]